jgi:hypothetical protein
VTSATDLPEPGWYEDPLRPDGLRYWDGDGWTDHEKAASGAVPESERSNVRRAVAVTVAVVLLAGGGFWIWQAARGSDDGDRGTTGTATGARSEDDPRVAVQRWCHANVATQLKVPGTAQFESFGSAAFAQQGTGSWSMTGYVDAEDSQGDHVRARYSCTAKKGDDETVEYYGTSACLEADSSLAIDDGDCELTDFGAATTSMPDE